MSRAAGSNSFLYIASKSGGGRAMGLKSARSERALAATLRREKQILVRTWKLPSWVGSEREMSLKDHAEFDAQLGILLERGVPLTEAIEVASTVVSSANQSRIERLRSLVAQGTSFADACKQVGSFDDVTVSVYRASEKTGDLAGACEQLATSARRRLEVAGKAVTLMIYPCIVLTIALIAGLFMLTMVVPTIGESLTRAGAELPWYTALMMSAGNFAKSNIIFIIAGLVVTGVCALLGRDVLVQSVLAVTRKLPLVRSVILEQDLTRFFAIMASMTRSGIPLGDAIGVASTIIGHGGLRSELNKLQQRLVEGGLFRSLVDRVETLPVATRKLLIAADQAGDLESAFDTLAEDHAKSVDKKTARLMAFLEPLLIIMLFLVVGVMILAIMVPMLSLSGSLQ